MLPGNTICEKMPENVQQGHAKSDKTSGPDLAKVGWVESRQAFWVGNLGICQQ
jgi:hypothetical protein